MHCLNSVGAALAGLLLFVPAAVSELDSSRDLPETANDHGFVITKGRAVVPCRIPGQRTLTILIAGQSNAANYLGGDRPRYQPGPAVVNFNSYDGKCYATKEPLLGAGGVHGSFATRLGDMIHADGLTDRVILAPVALGSTAAFDWSGPLFPRITAALVGLRGQGLKPDLTIYAQGEAEAMTPGYSAETYRSNVRTVAEKLRGANSEAPFYVAVSTTCRDDTKTNAAPIRAVQQGIADRTLDIRVGPDTDRFGADFRTDGCHFNARGADEVARAWLEIVVHPVLHEVVAKNGQ